MPTVALETTPRKVYIFKHIMKHGSFGGSGHRRMFTINCCEHVPADVEAVSRVLKQHITVCATYSLKSMYDRQTLEKAGPTRRVHLAQILESPAHAAMERVRDTMGAWLTESAGLTLAPGLCS